MRLISQIIKRAFKKIINDIMHFREITFLVYFSSTPSIYLLMSKDTNIVRHLRNLKIWYGDKTKLHVLDKVHC